MSKRTTDIVILESSQIIFEGLSNVLLKSGKYFRIVRIENFDNLNSVFNSEKPDVIVINPMQVQNKIKEFNSLKKNYPDVTWVALVYSFFDQHLISLFDKTIHITDSKELILNVLDKPENSDTHINHLNGHEQLSERETEVLKLIIAGLSNKEIADKLFISVHTVISHRKNISQKTGIKSQAGLTIYALSNKIVLMDDFNH